MRPEYRSTSARSSLRIRRAPIISLDLIGCLFAPFCRWHYFSILIRRTLLASLDRMWMTSKRHPSWIQVEIKFQISKPRENVTNRSSLVRVDAGIPRDRDKQNYFARARARTLSKPFLSADDKIRIFTLSASFASRICLRLATLFSARPSVTRHFFDIFN